MQQTKTTDTPCVAPGAAGCVYFKKPTNLVDLSFMALRKPKD